MSFQWLRLWTDAIDDEKLKLLAFEDRWHFIAILCMKRKGILDAPDTHALRDRKVGAKLGLGDRDRDEVRNRLREVGLINEHWQPLAWGKRQFVSDADPTALERKKRQREKQRHGRVTRDNRDSHARVTDTSRSGHTPQTQTQTTETEDKKVPSEPVPQERDAGPVEHVFEHWRVEFGHPRSQLDPKRRRVIQAALKTYDEATLRAAISGYRNSPHHMGQNERRTVYDDIELFLRDATHIENGLKFARGPPPPAMSAVARAREKLRNGNGDGRVVSEQFGGQSEASMGATAGLLRRVPDS